jgi:hypothetical protein
MDVQPGHIGDDRGYVRSDVARVEQLWGVGDAARFEPVAVVGCSRHQHIVFCRPFVEYTFESDVALTGLTFGDIDSHLHIVATRIAFDVSEMDIEGPVCSLKGNTSCLRVLGEDPFIALTWALFSGLSGGLLWVNNGMCFRAHQLVVQGGVELAEPDLEAGEGHVVEYQDALHAKLAILVVSSGIYLG